MKLGLGIGLNKHLSGSGAAVFGGPWTPEDLTSPLAWYDASDASTITTTGALVDQFDDKIGSNNLTSVGADRPTYATNQITFDGTNELSVASRFGLAANPALAVFCVMEVVSNIGTDDGIWQVGTESNSALNKLIGSGGTAGWAWRYNGGNRIFSAVTLSTLQTVFWGREASDTYGDAVIYVDGTALTQSSVSNGTGVPTDTGAYFSVGKYNPTVYSNIILHEMVVAEGVSTDDRQKTEGYLAHKWDGLLGGSTLVTALPGGHPYKSSAP